MHAGQYVDQRVGRRPGARAVAILALVLGAAGVVFLVFAILDSPLLALVTVILAPAFLALVFLAITSEGARRRIGFAGAVLIGVAVVGLHIGWSVAQDGWRFNGLIGLVLLAAALSLAKRGPRHHMITPPSN
jgi:cytochrome c oxidase subunit IV